MLQIKWFALAMRTLFVREAFMEGHEDYTLQGMCEWASYALLVLLRERGVAVEMVEGYFWRTRNKREVAEGHYWLYLPDYGQILDVTAIQFGAYPSVYVVPPSNRHYSSCDRGEHLVREAGKCNDLAHAVIRKFRKEDPHYAALGSARVKCAQEIKR